MILSKSNFTATLTCPKAGWLNVHKKEVAASTSSVMKMGSEVGDLAMNYFGHYVEVPFGRRMSMVKKTNEFISVKNSIICEASFLVDDLFCSCDILKILDFDKKIVELYEVKSTTKIKDYHKMDIAFQVNVLTKSGYIVKKAGIILVNKDYEYKKNLAISKLFKVEDVTEEVSLICNDIDDKIAFVRSILDSEEEPTCCLSETCHNPYDCSYFDYCSGGTNDMSIFSLEGITFKKKIEFFNNGITSFCDVVKEKLKNPSFNISERALMQIKVALGEAPEVFDKEKVSEFLNTFKFPLYFLDYETIMDPVPKHKGIHPYEQVPFQFSLHMLTIDGTLTHEEFLAKASEDPRYASIKKLISSVGSEGTILAYNSSFERTVIKTLAEQYPKYKEELMNIYDRIEDLMIPFQKCWVYKKSFNGSYSIKKVLPGLFPGDPSLDYHSLDAVQNGTMAMNAYRSLPSLKKKEAEYLRYRLLRYCELDTFAMVKIFYYLRDKVNEEEKTIEIS